MITGRRGDKYRRASGNLMSREEFEHHLSNGLSGLFSLGGQPDHLIVEYCVQFDPIFDKVSYKGVPDIRIIVFLGYPVMAMIRLPTRLSDGKANLHQGAIGVGIDIPTGRTKRGVWGTEIIREHPDTEHSIVNLAIPHWNELLGDKASLDADIFVDAGNVRRGSWFDFRQEAIIDQYRLDANYFFSALGGDNQLKFGGGFREQVNDSGTIWPGGKIVWAANLFGLDEGMAAVGLAVRLADGRAVIRDAAADPVAGPEEVAALDLR